MRLEMVTAKKQNEEYRQLVDKGKMVRSIQERKKAKQSQDGEEAPPQGEEPSSVGRKRMGLGDMVGDLQHVRRRFHQHKPLTMDGDGPVLDAGLLGSALSRSAKKKGATLNNI